MNIRIFIHFLLFTGSLNSLWSQSINYQDLFGDDWKKALNFEEENRNWIEPILVKNHISYPLAISVVFPEMVRYSALRDKMETSLLKTLYVNLGDDYADFSIGQFQMKPSFAELICDIAPEVMGHNSEIIFKKKTDYEDIRDFRKSILKDLEDLRSQVNYLIAFMKICENNYKACRKDEISKVKFLATAYNFGINRKEAEIELMIDKKFYNTKLVKTENYSYADVALFWYNNHKKQ